MIDPASIEAVVNFRDEFVKFTDDAIAGYRRGGLRSYIDRSAIPDFRTRQDALNERYGELYAFINVNGATRMTMPALGVISHDVIQDAINDLDDSEYLALVEGARQHLSRSIGALRLLAQGESNEEVGTARDPSSSTRPLPDVGERRSGLPPILRRPVPAVVTSIVLVLVGAVTLFLTVFGADWANVQRNWSDFVEWLPF